MADNDDRQKQQIKMIDEHDRDNDDNYKQQIEIKLTNKNDR